MEYPLKKYQLFAILVGILLLINGLMLPYHLSFRDYLCGDSGSALYTSSMIRDGSIPWLDFNYNYGFATLWPNQLWFNSFGYTPVANLTLNLLCSILLCWGIAEMITVMQWNRTITWLVLLSTLYLFCYTWFSTAHVLAPALIVLSIVRYLRRSYASALFLATLALLVMPSLAYFTGLYLVFVILFSYESAPLLQRIKRFVWTIAPSLGLLLAYTIYILSNWGWQVYFNSLVPLIGLANYQESGCGIFARGKLFWLPDTENAGQLLDHYLLTPAGAWIVGTIMLIYFTIITAMQWIKTRSLSIQQRCIMICGLLHLAFIFVLFGGNDEWAWTYELYLLIFGVAACLTLLPGLSRLLVPIYALVVLLSLAGTIRTSVEIWQGTARRTDMHSLFMSDSMYLELSQLRTVASQHRVLMLTRQGAPSLMLEGVEGVPTWAYMRHSAKDHERLTMLQLIDQADVVVVPVYPFIEEMTTWPEIADHLKRLNFRKKTSLLPLLYH